MYFYFSLKVGWGWADLEYDIVDLFLDCFFVFIFEIGIELNMIRFFCIGLIGGYWIVNGVSCLLGLDN